MNKSGQKSSNKATQVLDALALLAQNMKHSLALEGRYTTQHKMAS